MEGIQRTSTSRSGARTIVYAGVVAAAYAVLVMALAPISFGPLQFRVAGLLKPAALLHPAMAWGLAMGVGLANLSSPFGAWDFLAMPIVSFVAARVCWSLRRWPVPALLVQAAIIAVGVALFPLYLGGAIPVWPTVGLVFVSESVLYLAGWFLIWRWYATE
jgi:hypothetical protein